MSDDHPNGDCEKFSQKRCEHPIPPYGEPCLEQATHVISIPGQPEFFVCEECSKHYSFSKGNTMPIDNDHKGFFNKAGLLVVRLECPSLDGGKSYCSVEELYQHFKARILHERTLPINELSDSPPSI
jgi:hypothetical protein